MKLKTMKNKIILGFVGPIASGKGTACLYLKNKHGAEIFRFSTILRDVLDRFYIEHSRDNLQTMSSALRKIFGEDLMAKTIANDVKNSGSAIIVVDGVRRMADIKFLEQIPGFYLVEINADQKIRFERIIKRSENSDDAKKTFAELQKDEQQECELQIKDTAQAARFHINNDGVIEELYRQLEDILKQVSK